MKFSIITPCFNSESYIARCCASVQDQDVEYEHIVIDGGSTDKTIDLLKSRQHISWISESDEGMYDALNKGFNKASGQYLAWLNADEQYLPKTLKRVEEAFKNNPKCDIICSDSLVVDTENKLICIRRGEPLRTAYILNEGMHLLTCSIFFRRSLWDQGLRFNASLKSVGENDFFLNALRAGCRTKYINILASAFTYTGENLGASELSKKELGIFRHKHRTWYTHRLVGKMLTVARRIEKFYRGAYYKIPSISYELYNHLDLKKRTTYICSHPTYKWPVLIGR